MLLYWISSLVKRYPCEKTYLLYDFAEARPQLPRWNTAANNKTGKCPTGGSVYRFLHWFSELCLWQTSHLPKDWSSCWTYKYLLVQPPLMRINFDSAHSLLCRVDTWIFLWFLVSQFFHHTRWWWRWWYLVEQRKLKTHSKKSTDKKTQKQRNTGYYLAFLPVENEKKLPNLSLTQFTYFCLLPSFNSTLLDLRMSGVCKYLTILWAEQRSWIWTRDGCTSAYWKCSVNQESAPIVIWIFTLFLLLGNRESEKKERRFP